MLTVLTRSPSALDVVMSPCEIKKFIWDSEFRSSCRIPLPLMFSWPKKGWVMS